MIITALKAFDIVYVMTNGNFGTDVIANRMYKELFNVRNFGRASAIAVILLLAIVPVMLTNIRRFRAQEAMR
jgi:alpha-glucoside transport system permease protein